jgi:hypothetical protein
MRNNSFALHIPFFLFCFVFCACGGKVEEEKKETPLLPTKILVSENDTFYAGNHLLYITDTSKAAFDGVFKPTDTSEINNLNINKDFVTRRGDTLLFLLSNGKTKKLISTHYVEGMDSFTEYKYLGRIKSINYHVIFVQLYEAFSYLMINAESGKETTLWGVPSVSPNKKQVAASCFDLQAGFVYNGIQIFNVANDSLTPKWSRELTKWGADNIAWLNDECLVAEKMQLDSSQNAVTSHIKISWTGK